MYQLPSFQGFCIVSKEGAVGVTVSKVICRGPMGAVGGSLGGSGGVGVTGESWEPNPRRGIVPMTMSKMWQKSLAGFPVITESWKTIKIKTSN